MEAFRKQPQEAEKAMREHIKITLAYIQKKPEKRRIVRKFFLKLNIRGFNHDITICNYYRFWTTQNRFKFYHETKILEEKLSLISQVEEIRELN